MVPNKFNIVDFGGFDLVEQSGETIPGIYDKIIEANWNCVYIMCFGLKFSGMDIAPQYMTPEIRDDVIVLNGNISIDRDDAITVNLDPGPIPEPVIEPLTAKNNGIYTVPEGVDGFNPVSVNVGQTTSIKIKPASILVSSNILVEYDCLSIFPSVQDLALGDAIVAPGLHICPSSASKLTYDLGESNHSVTAYVVVKMLSGGGNYQILGVSYSNSAGNAPNIFSNGAYFYGSVYGNDFNTGMPYNKFAVFSISVDAVSKKIKYYANGEYLRENSFSNSGRYVSFGSGVGNNGSVMNVGSNSLLYIAAVDGVEDSQTIVDNHLRIMNSYSDYIGT